MNEENAQKQNNNQQFGSRACQQTGFDPVWTTNDIALLDSYLGGPENARKTIHFRVFASSDFAHIAVVAQSVTVVVTKFVTRLGRLLIPFSFSPTWLLCNV